MSKITRLAEEDGMGRWKWARILDIYQEEALRGKTHEYSCIEFQWQERMYRLIDTPGIRLSFER